jgi:hypothetical protein
MYTNILKCAALAGFTAFMVAANSLVAHADPAIPNVDGVDSVTYDADIEPQSENVMSSNELNNLDAIALEPAHLEPTHLEPTDQELDSLSSLDTTEPNTLDMATPTDLEAIEPNPFDLALNEVDWVDDWDSSVELDTAPAMDIAAAPASLPPTTDFPSDTFLSLNETLEVSSTPKSQTVTPNAEMNEAIGAEAVITEPSLTETSLTDATLIDATLTDTTLTDATVTEATVPEEITATPETSPVSNPVESGSVDAEPIAPLVDAVDSTSAMDLINPPTQAQTTDPAADGLEVPATPGDPAEADTSIAQVIAPGQPTRSGPSYIGAGGNIGFGGSTGIGRGNFAVFSKLGLTNNFSLRPAVFIGDRTTFLIPVTLDFPTGALVDDAVPFSIAPYAGGGIGISTGDDSQVRPIIIAGVDAPITNQFTATAGVTVGFFRNTEVGLMLGIGYNFGGF